MTTVRWFLTVLLAAAACIWLLTRTGMASSHHPESVQLPPALANADRACKQGDAEAFLHALVKSSFGKDSPDKRPMREQAQVVRGFLRQVEEMNGRDRGLELISELPVSTSSRVVYYVLKFERGPVYGILSPLRHSPST